MSKEESNEVDPYSAHDLAVDAIHDLKEAAEGGDAVAADLLMKVATVATQSLAVILGGEIPGSIRSEKLKGGAPTTVVNHLKKKASKALGWPVIVTNRKRMQLSGVLFTICSLKDYLEDIGLGKSEETCESATAGRTPEFDELVAHIYRQISPCCEELARESEIDYVSRIVSEAGLLPPLLRNGLKRDDWTASETGKAWKNALRLFLPHYFECEDWHLRREFAQFEPAAKRDVDRRTERFTDNSFKNFILGKLLGGLHALAGD